MNDFNVLCDMEKRPCKKSYLFLTLLFFQFYVFGEAYENLYFEHLNNNQGLISDEVNYSYQDANGFMWFATSEGIVRYDGYEFNSFKDHPYLGSLYGVDVRMITSCEKGNIYICTESGFYAFSEKLEPIYKFATTKLKDVSIHGMLLASDKTIYLTTDNGVYVINTEEQEVRWINEFQNRNIFSRAIIEDPNGNIWLGSWGNGLLRLNEDKDSFTAYSTFKSITEGTADNNINSIFIDSNGYLWVAVWEGGVYVMDISSMDQPKTVKTFVHTPGLENCIPGNIILDIFEDQYNGVWLGTPYGVALLRYPFAKRSEFVRYSYGRGNGEISSNVIRHFYQDNSNLIWLATKGGGVNKVNIERNRFDYYSIPELDPQKLSQSAHAFQIDHKGRLLVGVLHLGFVVYDQKSQQWYKYQDLPDYKNLSREIVINTVNSFLWDKDSTLWLGTRYNGIVTIDPRTRKVQKINSTNYPGTFRGRSVNTQLLNEDGSVWVGTSGALHLISAFDNNRPIVKTVELKDDKNEIISTVNITGIIRNGSNRIFAITYANGIYEIRKNKNRYEAHKWDGLTSDDKIVSCFCDAGGRLWLGTKGNGIKYIDKNTNIVNTPLPDVHLYGDVVFGISQDEYGSMWLTTNMGLVKLWFQQGEVKTERFLHRDGLQGNIFIPRSIYKDSKGLLYVGGYNGFNIFNPLKINGNYSRPPIVITDLFIEGERHSFYNLPEEKLKLNHIRNDFTATFAALDYIYPDANQYAYMLEGIDKEWKYVNAKMRSVNYSNLTAGEYVLKVKGSNNQGVWNEEYLELPILVSPAPYKTWWAILFYIFAISGVAIFILNQRRKVGRIKQKYELELLDKQKAKNLHEYKLRFFTNISHELLTPLSILSSVSENSIRKKAYSLNDNLIIQRNVNNLTRLIRQLLTFRKMESGNMSLKLVNGNIGEFASKAISDFNVLAKKRSISFDMIIDQDIEGLYDREKLEIILHNLLSNAFKYTDDGGDVICSLTWEKPLESIRVVVKDTGVGISKKALPKLFDRYSRGDKSEDKSGIGIGLNLTNSLVNILHGKIDVDSEKGVGSTFTVTLPVVSDAFKERAEVELAKEEIIIDHPSAIEEETEDKPEVNQEIPKGDYTILIAEDNDDFRKVLHNSLNEYFNIMEAVDGREALEMAEKTDVDLIISDVMMPNMTGKELCVKVKSEINLSHIPVILLTAKTGNENKLAGYEAGADAYIEKPVDLKMLLIRINNLIRRREKFKNSVTSMEVNLEPEKVSVTPLDQKFILDAKGLVEKNLSDPDFTVKTLSAELHVTSSMLYRKIKSLAGLPPNEFIRSIRLKRAAQMLENKNFTISEVAFNCGFNDLGYFGVCFKKMFGKTPTDYQNDQVGEADHALKTHIPL